MPNKDNSIPIVRIPVDSPFDGLKDRLLPVHLCRMESRVFSHRNMLNARCIVQEGKVLLAGLSGDGSELFLGLLEDDQ